MNLLTDSFYVKILKKPLTNASGCPGRVCVVKGGAVDLSFAIEAVPQPVGYQWHKNGHVLKETYQSQSRIVSGSKLLLKNASFGDSGNYTLSVIGSFGIRDLPVYLEVRGKNFNGYCLFFFSNATI